MPISDQPHPETVPTQSETTRDASSDAPASPSLAQKKQRWLLALALILFGVTGWQLYQKWGTVRQLLGMQAAPAEKGPPPWLAEMKRLRVQQEAQEKAGKSALDFSHCVVPLDEVRPGGPPKDGIPALTDPAFVEADQADYLGPEDRVIGVAYGKEAKAYPLKILNYHEIANDTVGDVPVAVTYCPLCDSAAVFDRRTPLGVREFGVSGMLYNSNVLMYDRGDKQESLWSQMMGEGISGAAAHAKLQALPLVLTTWKDWRERHPATQVLSDETGHNRPYGKSPYAGYFGSPDLMFDASPTSDRLPLKTRVLGVWNKESARAYPIPAVAQCEAEFPLPQELGEASFQIAYDPESESLRVLEAEDGIQWVYAFWFAWYAFHPETEVFACPGPGG